MEAMELSAREIAEEVEDYALFIEAEERMRNVLADECMTPEKAIEQSGILPADLDSPDEEID